MGDKNYEDLEYSQKVRIKQLEEKILLQRKRHTAQIRSFIETDNHYITIAAVLGAVIGFTLGVVLV
jgi:hypothetical protein